MVEKISAVRLRVTNMQNAVRFYRDLRGLELLYGGERVGFTSRCAKDAQIAILNLEQGRSVRSWGRPIFNVCEDSDATLLGAGCCRNGSPGMEQYSGCGPNLRVKSLDCVSEVLLPAPRELSQSLTLQR